MSVNVNVKSIENGREIYKIILAQTPAFRANQAKENRGGEYTFNIPPLRDNANSSHYNNAYVKVNKVILDPLSVFNGIAAIGNNQNDRVIWCNGGPMSEVNPTPAGSNPLFTIPAINLTLDIGAPGVGYVGDTNSLQGNVAGELDIFYKHQTLCPLKKRSKGTLDGSNGTTTSIKAQETRFITAPTTEFGSNLPDPFLIGNPAGMGPLQEPLLIKLDKAAEISQKAGDANRGTIIDNPVEAQRTTITTTSLIGNDFYYEYKSTDHNDILCANPFGRQMKVITRDVFYSHAPVYMTDYALRANATPDDITNFAIELEIILVKNPERNITR
tara:strand:+ start:1880 stop:2866 length:987 start_codon:yes stop_codon:yes gene_type:complete